MIHKLSLPSQPPSYSSKILWRDVNDLDSFLSSLYAYFLGKGYFCIASAQATSLVIIAFIIGFSTFMGFCLDYSQVHQKKILYEIIHQDCAYRLPFYYRLLLSCFSVWWIWNWIQFISDLKKLSRIQGFYNDILKIKDHDLYTMDWREISIRIIKTYEESLIHRPSSKKLDAHIIANRILRKDNYLIALFNKDILNLRVPFLSQEPLLTRLMEWSLSFCILSFVFDERGQLRKRFLKENNRYMLSQG